MEKNSKDILEVVTTTGKKILLDISDKSCIEFGFKHGDIAMSPNNNKVEIQGVAPGKDGVNVLWYTMIHPAIKGQVCYWGGKNKNLLEAGFYLYEELV